MYTKFFVAALAGFATAAPFVQHSADDFVEHSANDFVEHSANDFIEHSASDVSDRKPNVTHAFEYTNATSTNSTRGHGLNGRAVLHSANDFVEHSSNDFVEHSANDFVEHSASDAAERKSNATRVFEHTNTTSTNSTRGHHDTRAVLHSDNDFVEHSASDFVEHSNNADAHRKPNATHVYEHHNGTSTNSTGPRRHGGRAILHSEDDFVEHSANAASDPAANVTSAANATSGDSGKFYLIASRSTSPIHQRAVVANGGLFWIGKNSSTYTPPNVPNSPYNVVIPATIFGANGRGGLNLAVEVPGGQSIYINKNGALAFTSAHSAAIPSDALTGGWIYSASKSPYIIGVLNNFNGAFYACPTPLEGPGVYQIYIGIKGVNTDACLSFGALTSGTEATGAWQYV